MRRPNTIASRACERQSSPRVPRRHPPAGREVRAILSCVPDLLSFTCPRCGAAADDRYYGPCESCRTALRREVAGEARAVADAAYEPKMNVTPNAVALKDD